jgi:RimJ/RimL family protein N-acetyltransferase
MIGKKCYLSPIDPEDAEKYTRWLNDQEVTAFLDLNGKVIDLAGERAMLAELAKEHNYAVLDLTTDELIGICGYNGIDQLNRSGEVGIFIGNKDYWSKGYGAEALSLLIDFGFRSLDLHNILLRVYSFNTRAKAMYEKLGFKLIGVRREALRRNREVYNILYMDLLPDDFYPSALLS